MRILITGGRGFVGRHLARRLSGSLTLLDTRHEGPAPPGATAITGSVLDIALVERLVPAHDVVIHLAGVAEPLLYGLEPLRTLEVNLQGSLNVARACAQHAVPLLFASTSEVYGRNPAVPWDEGADRVLGPVSDIRWAYATAKAAVEHYLHAFRREKGLPFLVIRLFNVYGAGLGGRVVDAFLNAARAGEALRIHGDGKQSRCFCYVDDAVDALARLVEQGRFDGDTLNIGNPVPTEILDLAHLVLDLTGSSSSIDYVPYDHLYEGFADVPVRIPSVERIRARTGWEPTTELRDGLRRMIGGVG